MNFLNVFQNLHLIYDDIDKEMQHEMEEALKVAECKEGGIDA